MQSLVHRLLLGSRQRIPFALKVHDLLLAQSRGGVGAGRPH